jgi:hypothetical protein
VAIQKKHYRIVQAGFLADKGDCTPMNLAPVCRQVTRQSTIDLHPTLRDVAIHNFECADRAGGCDASQPDVGQATAHSLDANPSAHLKEAAN